MPKPTGFKNAAEFISESEKGVPPLTARQFYALHAPPPPDFWRIRNPVDEAHWRWTWADAMLKTEDWPTDTVSARQPPRPIGETA